MTDREQHAENRDCGADAAAYVLGALEPEEVEAFRAHMATCVKKWSPCCHCRRRRSRFRDH
jgi:anti-sigma factor RsiW